MYIKINKIYLSGSSAYFNTLVYNAVLFNAFVCIMISFLKFIFANAFGFHAFFYFEVKQDITNLRAYYNVQHVI